MHALDRWSEILLTLEKVSLAIDYIPFPSEAIRIDALKAEALFKLDRSEESLVVLDALLNFGELDETDEDIGDSFLVRAAILKNKEFAKASRDFQSGSKILISQKLEKRVQGFIQENPEFEGLTN